MLQRNLILMGFDNLWIVLSFEDRCAICLLPFRTAATHRLHPCGHVFHVNCIVACLRRRTACPLCRSDPFNDVSGDSSLFSSLPDAVEDEGERAAVVPDSPTPVVVGLHALEDGLPCKSCRSWVLGVNLEVVEEDVIPVVKRSS